MLLFNKTGISLAGILFLFSSSFTIADVPDRAYKINYSEEAAHPIQENLLSDSNVEIPGDTTNSLNNKVRVFLDNSISYQDYIKTEIKFVDYVRDRKEAQVHIMDTILATGSGGNEHTITFIGQQNFEGVNDTLKYMSKQTDTEETIRSGLVKTIKMGLMFYIAKTPVSKNILISYRNDEKKEITDKWNYWVFNIGGSCNMDGQALRKNYRFEGTFYANRTTLEWKTRASLYIDYNNSIYKMNDHSFSSLSRRHVFNGIILKSINEHWSAGVFGSAFSSIYDNSKFSFNIAPAIEYNLFPYSESTRRELRFTGRIGYTNNTYNEETIFNKIHEKLLTESLSISYGIKEKWGSISTSLFAANYFHDFSKNSLRLNTSLSLRLFEGFSLDINGYYSRIHDQLSLPKNNATEEDILLNKKQLATQYNFYVYVGLGYTFGSIYNNIVNPRFGE